ncbi:mannose-6-phosphate isomerase-like protein (cupin superfamily) [Streptomyces griseostramineus]|uniref:Mannose-6-phosphate isomerase-like protein (Cupin superfamily) n=1 Tax=Streptomyces griseomycini TaxID=66895 RepID=A0A7W7M1R8_9ACTN|nr:mannose-6-phosphate isomerase-like protein (cupin superfamily) [Streptomyces griseomycini]
MSGPVFGAPLPGAVGLSHLSPYDWEAADGLCGGSPHLHLVCTEAYVVTGGRGAVQTLSPDGHRDIPLRPGTVAWFTPGTVHRMVQGDGLRTTVLMQNSGLPEAGDAVFTFPPEVLADPGRYAAAAALPPGTGPETEAAARRRRDLAVEGYLGLREALVAGDAGPYREFQRAAARLVRDRVPVWRELWRAGALAAAERTGAHLDALAAGDPAHLGEATAYRAEPSRLGGFGMCGRRDEYALPGATVPYDGA